MWKLFAEPITFFTIFKLCIFIVYNNYWGCSNFSNTLQMIEWMTHFPHLFWRFNKILSNMKSANCTTLISFKVWISFSTVLLTTFTIHSIKIYLSIGLQPALSYGCRASQKCMLFFDYWVCTCGLVILLWSGKRKCRRLYQRLNLNHRYDRTYLIETQL